MDEVLRPVVLPFLFQNQCKYQAYDDNTRTSRLNQQNQNNVVRIDCPVRSSDMSTIENVKDIFGQRV